MLIINKDKDGQLESLAKITINRILVRVVGDMPRYKLKEPAKIDEITNKWASQVKGLLLRICQDYLNIRQNA
jgi:hypothetical protein